MKEFMLIYKGVDKKWMAASAEEKQAVMAKWGEWMGGLTQKGQLVTGGSPLMYDGRIVTKDGLVTDMSLAEVKELVTGYSIIKAQSYEQAAQIAKSSPIFSHEGSIVEVRAIAAM